MKTHKYVSITLVASAAIALLGVGPALAAGYSDIAGYGDPVAESVAASQPSSALDTAAPAKELAKAASVKAVAVNNVKVETAGLLITTQISAYPARAFFPVDAFNQIMLRSYMESGGATGP